MKSRIVLAFLLVLAGLTFLPAQTAPKVKVLILTGVNGHNWRATTPLLREILESTGRFDVHVNEEVRGNTLETFSPYDVLLLTTVTGRTRAPGGTTAPARRCSTS